MGLNWGSNVACLMQIEVEKGPDLHGLGKCRILQKVVRTSRISLEVPDLVF